MPMAWKRGSNQDKKSCWMPTERVADECAERGYTSDHETLCSVPKKYGFLWLRIRPKVRDLAKDHNQELQSDRAPKFLLNAFLKR
jgi:hypothetical protein